MSAPRLGTTWPSTKVGFQAKKNHGHVDLIGLVPVSGNPARVCRPSSTALRVCGKNSCDFKECVLFAVDVKIHSRKVMVKGPRGVLRRNFRHLQVDISMPTKKTILVEKWFGIKQELAAVRTVCSHIENMFKGVMKVSLNVCPVLLGENVVQVLSRLNCVVF